MDGVTVSMEAAAKDFQAALARYQESLASAARADAVASPPGELVTRLNAALDADLNKVFNSGLHQNVVLGIQIVRLLRDVLAAIRSGTTESSPWSVVTSTPAEIAPAAPI